MSAPESATEPQSLEQLCEMQERLLQRSLAVVDVLVAAPVPTLFQLQVAQELLDDLHAHVDPDAPLPSDLRLMVLANRPELDRIPSTPPTSAVAPC